MATLLVGLGLATAGCGSGEGGSQTTATTEAQAAGTDASAATGPGAVRGDPVAGKSVFTGISGCAGCHTLRDAGSTSTVASNLDESRPSEQLIRDVVANGKGAMPSYKRQLDEQQIADVAAYVSSVTGR